MSTFKGFNFLLHCNIVGFGKSLFITEQRGILKKQDGYLFWDTTAWTFTRGLIYKAVCI